VRFLNYNEDFNGLVDAKEIEEKVAKVPFSRGTRLGEVLNYKIVQPMVIQKVKEQKLKKPVLIVLIINRKVSRFHYPNYGNTNNICSLMVKHLTAYEILSETVKILRSLWLWRHCCDIPYLSGWG
jgi:hypothetical protein